LESSIIITLFIVLSIVAANVPWMSDRYFMLVAPTDNIKSIWARWLEWIALYFVMGFVGLGLEQRFMGTRSEQGWEFFVINFCLFLVFALPGFIYKHDLKKLLRSR
jgi:hypothetical protein